MQRTVNCSLCFFFLFHWNWNLRWNSKQNKIFPHNKDQFSCLLTQIPNQTGIPNPLCCHLTRTRSTIPSTTNHTAIQHWTTDRIRSSFILAVNAIFVSQVQLQITRRLRKQRPAAVSTWCMIIVVTSYDWEQVKNGKWEDIGISFFFFFFFFFLEIGKPQYKADCVAFNSKRKPRPYLFCFIIQRCFSRTPPSWVMLCQLRPMSNYWESSISCLN